MKPTRRALLAGLATLGVGALAPAPRARADLAGPVPLRVRTYAISDLGAHGLADGLYGRLRFRAGLELQSSEPAFGGLSSLALLDDGASLLAVSDHGYWFSASLRRGRDGVLVDVSDAMLAPLLGADGALLWREGLYDSEALTVIGEAAYVGFEQIQVVYSFDLGAGRAARGERLVAPEAAHRVLDRLWGNKGIEAVFVARTPSPLAGSLIAIVERAARGATAPTVAVGMTGPAAGATLAVARSEGFDITDAAVLPGGDLLLLERRYTLLGGVAARIRRVPATGIAPDALLDGPVIFEADWTNAIDNMEGLAVHRGPDGETLLTLVSDDNFSMFQRTLLLEFELVDG